MDIPYLDIDSEEESESEFRTALKNMIQRKLFITHLLQSSENDPQLILKKN
jgi:hypothetical protein